MTNNKKGTLGLIVDGMKIEDTKALNLVQKLCKHFKATITKTAKEGEYYMVDFTTSSGQKYCMDFNEYAVEMAHLGMPVEGSLCGASFEHEFSDLGQLSISFLKMLCGVLSGYRQIDRVAATAYSTQSSGFMMLNPWLLQTEAVCKMMN